MNGKLKKLAVSAAATVAAVAGTVALSPGTAHASGNFTAWLSPASNPYIFADVQGGSTSSLAPVILYHWTGGSNQKWVFWQQAGGDYLIQNVNSGKCLWASTTPGDQVRQAPCDGNQHELWRTGVSTDYIGRPAEPLPLTEREREVLALVAEGHSNGRIATALYISPKTASVHGSNILAKLDVSTRTEAATVAHRLGLLRSAG
jgi:DNA-binding CsgD family transcriptional regulator